MLAECFVKFKALNKIMLIWKAVLNFQLYDLTPSIKNNKKELNVELSLGYQQIKEYLIKIILK